MRNSYGDHLDSRPAQRGAGGRPVEAEDACSVCRSIGAVTARLLGAVLVSVLVSGEAAAVAQWPVSSDAALVSAIGGFGQDADSRNAQEQNAAQAGAASADNANAGNAEEGESPQQDGGQGNANGAAQGVGTEDEDAEAARIDRTTPRSTMRTFLLAVEEAKRDTPARIRDAVRCLDLTEVPQEERAEKGKALARRLQAVIDRIGVRLDDVPEVTESAYYEFFRAEAEDEAKGGAVIAIAYDFDTGKWSFTSETLTSIPALEAIVEAKGEVAAEDSAIPAAFRNPRATMETFLDAMNGRDLDTAARCFDPAGHKADAWITTSRELAAQLKIVMDKTKQVVLSEIPESATKTYTWHTYDQGSIEIGRVESEPRKGEWLFTPSTSAALSDLYRSMLDDEIIAELRDAGVEESAQLTFALRLERAVPPSLRQRVLYLGLWQWLALAALVVLGLLLRWVVTFLFRLVVGGIVRRRGFHIDRDVLQRVFWWSGAVGCTVFWLLMVSQLGLPAPLLEILLPALKLPVALSLTWFLYRVVDLFVGYVARDTEVRLTHFDDLLLPLLRTVLRMVVIVLVILFVLEWVFAQPPRTVLGAIGIGGLAVAFAAKDTLGNFFGSITVLFDRPFGIGDWVVIDDVEGTVEHVGFRSTRIRTFYNSRVTIPNSTMSTAAVDNFGARRYRRLKATLSLTYGTPPERIEAFCEGVRELIRLHPYTRKDYYHVYFNAFAASSLDVMLYMFLDTPDWGTELREKHRLFLDILRLAREIGVEFAFPTQTVWLERSASNGGAGASMSSAPEAFGVDAAAGVFGDGRDADGDYARPVQIETRPRSRSESSSAGSQS